MQLVLKIPQKQNLLLGQKLFLNKPHSHTIPVNAGGFRRIRKITTENQLFMCVHLSDSPRRATRLRLNGFS
jgi:hypothetical protein